DPEIQARMRKGGAISVSSKSPEDFKTYMDGEAAKWAEVIEESGVGAEGTGVLVLSSSWAMSAPGKKGRRVAGLLCRLYCREGGGCVRYADQERAARPTLVAASSPRRREPCRARPARSRSLTAG